MLELMTPHTNLSTHQLIPIVSHSSCNKLRVSSDKDAWKADRENGIELSFGSDTSSLLEDPKVMEEVDAVNFNFLEAA